MYIYKLYSLSQFSIGMPLPIRLCFLPFLEFSHHYFQRHSWTKICRHRSCCRSPLIDCDYIICASQSSYIPQKMTLCVFFPNIFSQMKLDWINVALSDSNMTESVKIQYWRPVRLNQQSFHPLHFHSNKQVQYG